MRVLLGGLGPMSGPAVEELLRQRSDTIVVAGTPSDIAQCVVEPIQVAVIEGSDVSTARAFARALRAAPACREAVILAVVNDADAAQLPALLQAGVDDVYFVSLGQPALAARLAIDERAATARAARQTAEQQLQRFFALSLDMLCIAGLDGLFQSVSPSWTKILGWSAEELCAAPWLDFVHPDDVQATLDAGRKLGAGATVTTFANRYRCRDGAYRWLDWQAVPYMEQGLIYAVARDVTEQHHAQEALRSLTQSLATTLSSIGDGVIATDGAGRVVRMNPVAERLTQWSIAEAIGKPVEVVLTLMNATTREAVANPVVEVVAKGVVVGMATDTLLMRRDGTEVPVADSCAPIRDGNGDITGAVLVFRDATLEEEAKRAQTKIQTQLMMADRMSSVGTLAAGVAHEINNPLSYVMANLEMIGEDLATLASVAPSGAVRDLRDMVTDALAGAERVRKIVRGLKTFSRAEEERRCVIDVRQTLELSINMAFNEIRHRARLVKDYGETPPVLADDARLGQVFINLLVNAAHAIPEGNCDANEIRILTSTDPAGNAVIEVRDTGRGISASSIDRIFEPFYTTKPVGEGTGLGLSICHNIVTGMGGSITAHNLDAGGACFRVTIPRAERVPAAHKSDRIEVVVETPRAVVLIVDDEPVVGITLKRLLREHDVTVVHRARDALDLLSAGKHFDVILSDIMMPEMSGMDFYDALARAHPGMTERVVFVTGGAFTPAANAFLDAVPNERLEKPFDVKTIREAIKRFVT
ncbi:MAG: PAS domain S-box protein [Myxococcota bacterium]|nr:PAS domain S-box protein [Myxococcota bacterium]